MDLLAIVRKIWRYRLATLPVIFLTLAAGVYVVAIKDPVYEAASSYVLINPPAPPTAEDVANDPALGRINSDNPYTRFPDQSVVVDVIASTMSSETARRALTEQGADDRYTVGRASEFAYSSSPIIEVTGVGSSPQAAIDTATIVGAALTRELDRMQEQQGVAGRYRIDTQRVDAPDAELQASGQLRMLVGVLAIGTILLFTTVSAGDALNTLRLERQARRARSGPDGSGEDRSSQGEAGDAGSGHDEAHESGTNGTNGRRARDLPSRKEQHSFY